MAGELRCHMPWSTAKNKKQTPTLPPKKTKAVEVYWAALGAGPGNPRHWSLLSLLPQVEGAAEAQRWMAESPGWVHDGENPP